MAKGKTDDDQAKRAGKYSDAELAEFVSALETDAPDSTNDAPEAAPTPRGRKIVVQEESAVSSKHSPAPDEEQPDISAVLTPPPPTEMQHLTKSPRHFPWGWTIGIIALLAAVSVAGFFVFNRAKKFSNTNVQLQFKPPAAATSGSSLTLTIEYQNLEPVDLTKVQLAVEYPAGFTYTSSEPAATGDGKNAFDLGTVRSGQAGQVTLVGTIIGAIDETRDFSATMTYRPSTFNSDFQQQATTQVKITASILGLALTGPTQLAPGATGAWTVAYSNTSDHDLPEVQINATYPDGFTVISTNPAAQEKSAVWKIDVVKQGAQGTITIAGKVDGNIGDTLPLQVSVGLRNSTNTIDLQDEQSLLIILVKTGVTTTVAVNGSTDPVVIGPGEMLNYSVRVLNSSDLELTNATVTVKLEGAALDLTKLANDSKGLVKDNVLTWTKDQLAALASLKPAQVVTISFAVGAKSTLTVATDADRDPHVTATINVTAPGLATNTNTTTPPSTVVVSKLSTVLALKAEARYYDTSGQAIGSGPLPPKVGQTTVYRVTWTITNTTSDANNLVVSARLPNTTLWTGQNLNRDAGDLVFDPDSRMVRWTLNTVPAGTGGRLAALTASFDLSITPTADQVGAIPILIETATATATDSYTNKTPTSPAATLTTDLPSDTKAAGQGQVTA